MYELKTKETENSVVEFIEKIESAKKREDAYKLVDLFSITTGYKARMWGPSIIGFGKYHYVYKTGHEGDTPIVAFSPRKAKISLYLTPGKQQREELLKDFGKFTSGKSCLYINKLADIDIDILVKLIEQTVLNITRIYPKAK